MAGFAMAFSHTKEALNFLENQLQCCICQHLASSPVTLGGCEHIFCSTCCEPYLGRTCPVCEIPAHVRDAEVDRQLFNIVTLCQRLRVVLSEQDQSDGAGDGDGDIQCTPNQPIPGSVSRVSHMTSNCLEDAESEVVHNNQVIQAFPKPGSDTKKTATSSRRRRNKNVVDGKSVEQKPQEAKAKATSHDHKSPKRRKSIPDGQQTMTQFYDYDDSSIDDVSVHEELKKGTNSGRKQGSSTLDVLLDDASIHQESKKRDNANRKHGISVVNMSQTVKTRLRHHSDSSVNQLEVSANSKGTESGAQKVKTRESRRGRCSSDPKCRDVDKFMTSSVSQKMDKRSIAGKAGGREASIGVESGHKQAEQTKPRKGKRAAQKTQLDRSVTSSSSQSLNKRNAKGETALQVAVIKNDASRVRELLSAGADPNVRDNAGWTPLHEACNHGYLELVELLLDNGAMINIPGLDNDTPLHDAISNNRPECVKLLVSRGASQTVRNIHGYTAQDLAVTEVIKAALNTPVVCDPDVSVTECDYGTWPMPFPTVEPREKYSTLSTLVDDCFTVFKQLGPDETPVDVLEYQQPCLLGTSLSRDEKISLQRGASKLHVKLLDEMCPEVTHIVTKCNAEGMCPRTVKLLQGILMGRWILNAEWFETSVQMGQLVCEEAFEVQGTSLFPNSGAMYKGRLNRKHQLPSLFNGCQFYFHGSFEYAVPSKEELMNILQCGGGQILMREPKPGHLDAHTLTVPYHADPNGELAQCCVFLVHESHVTFEPIRTKRMCSVPVSWIMDSAASFKLLPLPTV